MDENVITNAVAGKAITGKQVQESMMAEGIATIRAEIGAAVWKITAPPGTVVAEDEPVVILESMKMEIPVLAPHAGTVESVLVEEGQQVEEGQPVATIRR